MHCPPQPYHREWLGVGAGVMCVAHHCPGPEVRGSGSPGVRKSGSLGHCPDPEVRTSGRWQWILFQFLNPRLHQGWQLLVHDLSLAAEVVDEGVQAAVPVEFEAVATDDVSNRLESRGGRSATSVQ